MNRLLFCLRSALTGSWRYEHATRNRKRARHPLGDHSQP
jgi:hypothetical protein